MRPRITLDDASRNNYPSVWHFKRAIVKMIRGGYGVDDCESRFSISRLKILDALPIKLQQELGHVDGGFRTNRIYPKKLKGYNPKEYKSPLMDDG